MAKIIRPGSGEIDIENLGTEKGTKGFGQGTKRHHGHAVTKGKGGQGHTSTANEKGFREKTNNPRGPR